MKNEPIINICSLIDSNIEKLNDDIGLLSQNILSQCRNLCEAVIHVLYSQSKVFDQYNFSDKKKAIRSSKVIGKHRFLFDFHKLLAKSVSHYTEDNENSVRLMIKYREYLTRIRKLVKEEFMLDVLKNLDKFPLVEDKQISDYYSVIAKKINANKDYSFDDKMSRDRYYVLRKKPFFVADEVYYELTLVKAFDNISKQARVIAFTKEDIFNKYSIRICVENTNVKILGVQVEVAIIRRWEVSIRVCELNNFSKILNIRTNITDSSYEYMKIMEILTNNLISFVDLLYFDDESYGQFKSDIIKNSRNPQMIYILDEAKKIIIGGKKGKNILLYLLLKMNNVIIKRQINSNPNESLSNLSLKYGCIPFEDMPFATSLIFHNPNIFDLFDIFDTEGRECELLARTIKNKSEQSDTLFTNLQELTNFESVESLVTEYNSKLFLPKHKGRKLKIYKNHLYISENVESTLEIVKEIVDLSKIPIPGYKASFRYWLDNEIHRVDCSEKIASMEQMFENSSVALIYGSAGTGKTTIISHLSDFFDNNSKIYLTNTHSSKNNLETKVKSKNAEFNTIRSYLYTDKNNKKCDILFIDESSTVRNTDMKQVLRVTDYKLLVLVGDVHQIESINFGNWFSVARNFVGNESITELTIPYRSNNEKLIKSWDKVRNISEDIVEDFVQNNYSIELNETIFNYKEDQIILCLNYDGLYGINNINRILQASNKNNPIFWDDNIYKIGDPVLFNESRRFHPALYNNLKGEITEIYIHNTKIEFKIKVDKVINQMEANRCGLTFHEIFGDNQTIISFTTYKSEKYSDEEMVRECIIPFQVAYAISIHKAQGLEYENVKIIITNEVEELITHNIFYTAITRAKENLKIYWSPKTEKFIVDGLSKRNVNKDSALLKAMIENR